jgi:putative ABC transport system ATP-binding protein
MIHATHLTKVYKSGAGQITPVNDVSLDIDAGKVAFVIGKSGSGKSTLLNLLGALDRPTSGEVVVDGRDLGTLGNKARALFRRATVGFIFQTNNLLPPLSALRNVEIPLLPDGITAEGRREARESLERLGLAERLDHRPAQLSGGEQQRVAIARALVRKPKLLLADEPTGSLDSETGNGVMQALRGLVAERQMTAVIVTHTRDHIRDGDLICVMKDGVLSEADALAG